jgi:molybdate transport system substrate-binding protein
VTAALEKGLKMKKQKMLEILGGLTLFFGMGLFQSAVAGELHLFVGAGLRQPVDHLVKTFESRTGHRVFIDYAGSGQLFTRIEASGKGDLFIPGALFYIEKLEKSGKISSYRPIVQHTPVIGVNPARAERIKSFDDLAKPGVRLAMGDPKAMAFGRTAMTICERSGQKDAILKNVTVYGATVKQLALYASQGSVDAAIIGRCDAFQNRDKLTIVPIPPAFFQAEIIAAAVLKSASNPESAGQFRDYLTSPDAVVVFRKYGFLPLEK